MDVDAQQPKLSGLGLRAALMKIHTDLLTIHGHVDLWSGHYPPALTNLEKMVIVLEDRRFMRHAGVDLISVARELFRAALFKKHGGASTIDMQLVRTATNYRNRTLSRKLYEMLLALIIQYRYSKVVILRSYLNHAFFGSHRIGAWRAARLFNTYPDGLSLEQAATIAAMLVYPRPLAGGTKWSARVARRAKYGMLVYARHKERFDQLPS